ncbi:three-Cys-motif partner protein TcmP [Enterococcus asini]|uniref:three-Cys-motif partner protein TcmP n=1 Tax=Enterococcus asini TaxID=57732 RepID=UPI0022E435FB|nr:three-Cys-motif partner protein TcmP [Enterococcus asini]
MSDCNNKYGCIECIERVSKITHKGTKNKINFMKRYIGAWYNKVLRNGYEGVFFIDCMCNAGLYNDSGELFAGTSQEAMKSFLNQGNGAYSDKIFKILVNDIDSNRVLCQECVWNRCVSDIGAKANVLFDSKNKDVSDFLRTDAIVALREAEQNNYHVLLFYDPYNAKIDWNGLAPFLKSKKADIILTHFMSDPTRGINQAKTEEAKKKYSETYGLPFEKLVMESETINKTFFFRQRVKAQISKFTSKYVSYGPIFNSKNRVLYDIVLISRAEVSRDLLKRNLYLEYRDIQKEDDFTQGTLFAFESISPDDYNSQRAEGVSEKDYFYSPTHFAEVIYKHFKGQIVLNSTYNEYIYKHEVIPPNANRQIDTILKNQFHVTIVAKNKHTKGKYYDFREKRNE